MPLTDPSRAWQRMFHFTSIAILIFIFSVCAPFAWWALTQRAPLVVKSWTFLQWSDDGRYAIMQLQFDRLDQCVGDIVGTVVDGWVRPLPVAAIPAPTTRNPRPIALDQTSRIEIEIPRGLPLDSAVYVTRQYQYVCNPLQDLLGAWVVALPDIVLPVDTRPGGP